MKFSGITILKGEGNKNMKIPHNVSVKSYLKKRTLLLSIKNSKLTKFLRNVISKIMPRQTFYEFKMA